jgi:hypothetical protein
MAGNRPPDGSAKRTKRTRKKGSLPKWAKAFLEALKASGNVTYACAHAKVGRQTVYERREANEQFAGLWDEAIEDATGSSAPGHPGRQAEEVLQGRSDPRRSPARQRATDAWASRSSGPRSADESAVARASEEYG